MRINSKNGLLAVLAVLLTIALSIGVVANAQDNPVNCAKPVADAKPISAAKLYIEFMSTGVDLGVHGYFDDSGWVNLCVYDPNGVLVLAVSPQSQLYDLTMAGFFFESREPVIKEFTFDDLKARFPEGEYSVVATNYDGTGLMGAAIFTHNIPAPPVITSPVLTTEDKIKEVVHPVSDMVLTWEPVTETVDGKSVTIVGYEIIVTNMDGKHAASFAQPIYDVHVAADRKSLNVPAEFLQPGTRYEIEVVAIEESGNQTINNGYFTTK